MTESVVLDLVGSLYDAAGDPRLWPVFLDKLADSISGTTTSVFLYDVQNHNGNIAATVRIDPDSQRKYNEYYAAFDCWGVHGHHLVGTGDVALGQSLCTESRLERSEFYNDFLKPLDAFHQCCGIIRKEQSVLSIVASLRPRRRGPFGDAETALLQSLMPHLQRAVQLHQKIVDLQVVSDSANEALNRFPIGVVLCDTRGGIVMLNQSARHIVEQQDGLLLARQGLVTLRSPETRQLRAFILGAARAASERAMDSGGVMTVSRPSMRRPYELLVVPLRRGASWLGPDLAALHMPAAAVFITDPEAGSPAAEEILARLFQLTPAEARLSSLLMQGKSLEEAAETFDLSRNTVRSQLQTIFEKTGTRRQGELIRLLLNSPARLRSD